MIRKCGILIGVLCATLAGGLTTRAACQPAPAAPGLSIQDCGKCHEDQGRELQEAGEGHLTEVTCLDCHHGHPPQDMEVISPCSDCHQGRPHFKPGGPCLACHRNPHRPRELTLARSALAACLDCHPGVGEEFASAPSIHARFTCLACHEKHGEAFPCLECHTPHAGGDPARQNCQECHPPHRPLAVEPDDTADAGACLGCHQEAGQSLQAAGGPHLAVGCLGCHSGPHPSVPDCRLCHHAPHPEPMLVRRPDCRICHDPVHGGLP
ncbi:c-type cytochrome [Desulfuromonas versatilis]|uniref:C-type cytochrome n=1 Tax=Desulfuromonas versatilis TaxID=2802975 RepID=A0ABM9SE03_9BACT|nr:cytochrome c family protein [Desulfuromonas versatilis]BCR03990.1 c-type cytochrome [Desulfuromonas versatilis]